MPRSVISRLMANDGNPPGLVPAEDEMAYEYRGDDRDILSSEARCVSPKQKRLEAVSIILKKWTNLTPLLRAALKSYVKFISSAINQDKGLKFLQYTLWLASKLYQKDSTGRKSLTKLSLELSNTRYATRLLALPTAVEAALYKSWTSPSKSFPRTFDLIGDLLSWSMMVYYSAEHVAYLQWMVPQWLVKHKRSAERWSAWSCRGWFLYVVAEMVQNALQWKELCDQENQQQRLLQQQDSSNDTDEKRKKAAEAAEKRAGTKYKTDLSPEEQQVAISETQLSRRKIELQFARNALFLLPTIQYSLPNWDTQPWLPPDVINFLFWLESVVTLYQSSI